MNVKTIKQNGVTVAIVSSPASIITETQDALDLMSTLRYDTDCDAIILPKGALCEAFFDLKTRLAGDILQKFTTYQCRLAIVGDFSGYESRALRDFIYESNQGRQINFLPTEEEAVARLCAR